MKTITANAFKKRLSRHLAKDRVYLRTARPRDLCLGPFYTVNENNCVWDRGLSWDTLLEWGREAGLLRSYETVEEV
jgi:hypothetical protein